MGDLLIQALQLTVIGMGMTFLAIAALVAGMYGLTTLFPADWNSPQKSAEKGAEVSEADMVAALMGEEDDEARYVAAVAAVSVAVAQGAKRDVPKIEIVPPDSWTAYIRGQYTAQRNQYNALRD